MVVSGSRAVSMGCAFAKAKVFRIISIGRVYPNVIYKREKIQQENCKLLSSTHDIIKIFVICDLENPALTFLLAVFSHCKSTLLVIVQGKVKPNDCMSSIQYSLIL